MLKCLIFSDSHGHGLARMKHVIESHPDAEVIFFLGDGLSEAEALRAEFPDRMLLSVRGNCDFAPLSAVEETDAITLEGVPIVFTHGHLYDAKWSYTRLCSLAASRGAKICLFGHTHAPTEEYHVEGETAFTLFNPGSISRPNFGRPSYGVLTLANGTYLLSHGEADF